MFSEAGFLWFRRGITLVLIVVCNLVLLGALWGSGLDLDGVLTNAAFYDPQAGYCLRVAWVEVSGVAGRRMTAGKAGRRMTAKEHTHGILAEGGNPGCCGGLGTGFPGKARE